MAAPHRKVETKMASFRSERSLTVPVLLLCILCSVGVSDGCTLPSDFTGAWMDSIKGLLTFTNTSISGYEINNFGTFNLACYIENGTTYIMESNSFIFFSLNFSGYFCWDFVRVNENLYYYYEYSTPLKDAAYEKVKMLLDVSPRVYDQICANTNPDPSSYRVLYRNQSLEESLVASECPEVIQKQFSINMTTAGNQCSGAMEVCASSTTLTFNGSNCTSSIGYTAGGSANCLFYIQNGDMTYLTIANNDETVDGVTTYRVTCLIIDSSSTPYLVTQHPNQCPDDMNVTYVASPGTVMTWAETATCATYTATSSSFPFWVIGVVVGLLVLILIAMLCACLWYRKMRRRKQEEEKILDEQRAHDDQSTLPDGRFSEDDTLSTRGEFPPNVVISIMEGWSRGSKEQKDQKDQKEGGSDEEKPSFRNSGDVTPSGIRPSYDSPQRRFSKRKRVWVIGEDGNAKKVWKEGKEGESPPDSGVEDEYDGDKPGVSRMGGISRMKDEDRDEFMKKYGRQDVKESGELTDKGEMKKNNSKLMNKIKKMAGIKAFAKARKARARVAKQGDGTAYQQQSGSGVPGSAPEREDSSSYEGSYDGSQQGGVVIKGTSSDKKDGGLKKSGDKGRDSPDSGAGRDSALSSHSSSSVSSTSTSDKDDQGGSRADGVSGGGGGSRHSRRDKDGKGKGDKSRGSGSGSGDGSDNDDGGGGKRRGGGGGGGSEGGAGSGAGGSRSAGGGGGDGGGVSRSTSRGGGGGGGSRVGPNDNVDNTNTTTTSGRGGDTNFREERERGSGGGAGSGGQDGSGGGGGGTGTSGEKAATWATLSSSGRLVAAKAGKGGGGGGGVGTAPSLSSPAAGSKEPDGKSISGGGGRGSTKDVGGKDDTDGRDSGKGKDNNKGRGGADDDGRGASSSAAGAGGGRGGGGTTGSSSTTSANNRTTTTAASREDSVSTTTWGDSRMSATSAGTPSGAQAGQGGGNRAGATTRGSRRKSDKSMWSGDDVTLPSMSGSGFLGSEFDSTGRDGSGQSSKTTAGTGKGGSSGSGGGGKEGAREGGFGSAVRHGSMRSPRVHPAAQEFSSSFRQTQKGKDKGQGSQPQSAGGSGGAVTPSGAGMQARHSVDTMYQHRDSAIPSINLADPFSCETPVVPLERGRPPTGHHKRSGWQEGDSSRSRSRSPERSKSQMARSQSDRQTESRAVHWQGATELSVPGTAEPSGRRSVRWKEEDRDSPAAESQAVPLTPGMGIRRYPDSDDVPSTPSRDSRSYSSMSRLAQIHRKKKSLALSLDDLDPSDPRRRMQRPPDMDDLAWRRLLEELYPDKKYLDYAKATSGNYNDEVHLHGKAEEGLRYLYTRAKFWEGQPAIARPGTHMSMRSFDSRAPSTIPSQRGFSRSGDLK